MSKFRNALILITTLAIIVFAFTACERKGKLYPNEKPTIAITSYEGTSAPDSNAVLFQQKIYWEAHDTDGVVDKYAFAVVDSILNAFTDDAGNPVGTPGYPVVDDKGWVYHYQSGADESIPLSISTQRTIWTDQVYAVINFPAANVNGDSAHVTSVFQVKCKDNSGDECDEPARKFYTAESNVPRCTAGSTRGDINTQTVGIGMVLSFSIIDDDPFVGAIADHFEFRLEKRNLLGEVIPEADGGYNETWWSTIDENNIHQYLITLNNWGGTRASLKLNSFLSGAPQDSTYLISKVIDIAGIVSDSTTISFVVKEGFYPSSLIYNGIAQEGNANVNDVYALGENHFVTYIDEALGQLLPSVMTTEGAHYATPFWINTNSDYVALYSNDLKVYLSWGYNGEYQGNSPGSRKQGIVKDERTGNQYFSEIKYFDLRLDGEPYHYAPLPAAQYNFEDQETGKVWLRVPVSHAIAQETILTSLGDGTHKFEVRAVDLQDVGDATPTSFIFKVISIVPVVDKEGILILDDSPSGLFCPEVYVDSLYSTAYFLAGYPGTVDVLDRAELKASIWNSPLHWSKDVFSPTDLQNYKTVIYFADSPNEPNKFAMEYDVLNIYLRNGGNLIFSGGKNIAVEVQRDCVNFGFPILRKYFGIEEDIDAVKYVKKGITEANYLNLQYFIGATADDGFTQDIDMQFPSFNTLVSDALGPVSYFVEDMLDPATQVIYRFQCKPAGDGSNDPSQYEANFFNGQPVGLKKVTGLSKCYIFGFPLAYMVPEQVNTVLLQCIQEIETE
ncbi:MAG: hypothetical protein Q7J16_01140 [Candidatus Cloacimonadales bacterium]|nr:hypothetical protein [Candidatus Cloacimonadales bacterium]